jgi:LacI family transcriptional regulator
MIRVLLITDFTESFSHKLLAGLVDYSRRKEQWIVRRMPPSYKAKIGIPGVVRVAKEWEVDAVIAQFEPTDEVGLFAENGIVAIAQDYKKKFSTIPNITGDYLTTGRMAARFFIDRGFRNFGFFGFNDVCWSDERCDGFRREVEAAGFGGSFYAYRMQEIDMVWYYQQNRLREWLQSLPKPIAIMACDDNQGSNLIEVCHGAGIRIPSEVSVMGVDNDESLCSLGSTTLTSIQMGIERGGWESAALVERLVADPSALVEDVVLKPVKIVERMSTAAFATQDQQILKALLFIHQNVRKKISVRDVMTEAALSRRLLERRFKDVTGKTLYEYITDQKLKCFAELLQDTDEQVVNIALSMGENDTKSIARRFKQRYGCTPVEWREKQRKKNTDL